MISSEANGRLRNLRELHGMTQKQFAAELGLGQAQLSQIESGLRSVTEGTISAARYRFGIRPEFFSAPTIRYTDDDLNYRTRQLTARERRVANVTFGLTEQIVRAQSTSNSELPSLDIAHTGAVRPLQEIEAYAAAARDLIGVRRDKVINNVTRCVERAGVLVTGLNLPGESRRVDGISTPTRSDAPFVTALDLSKSGDRVRFSSAHEFGHILMHTENRPIDDTVREAEADMFASAFLLPRAPLLDELSPDLTLAGYSRVKARWGASIQAIIRRARDIGVVDQERYRSLNIQLSSRGWKTNEPVEIPREIPAIPAPDLFLASTVDVGGDADQSNNVVDLFGQRTRLGPNEADRCGKVQREPWSRRDRGTR